MAKLYNALDSDTAARIQDYGSEADYIHDHGIRCEQCLVLWEVVDSDYTGLTKVDTGYVCEEVCLAEYNEETRPEDHSTYHARGGSVVG